MKARLGIILFFMLGFCASSVAQEYNEVWYWKRKGANRRSVKRYSCPVLESIKSPHAIGVRIGDPIGITYKAWFLDRFGFEVIAGTSLGGVYVNFVRENFDLNPDYDTLTYVGHTNNYTASVQARLVMHNPLPEAISGTRGVDWYIGIGAMYRIIDVNYTYEAGIDLVNFEIGSFDEQLSVAGPEGILGFEYLLPGTQYSAFGEGGVFYDLLNDNSEVRFQGGVGLRYNL